MSINIKAEKVFRFFKTYGPTILMCIAALLIIVFGLSINNANDKRYASAQATVVEIGTFNNQTVSFVDFTDADGNPHTHIRLSSDSVTRRVGETLAILYEKDHPSQIRLSNTYLTVACVLLAALILIAALIRLLRIFKKQYSERENAAVSAEDSRANVTARRALFTEAVTPDAAERSYFFHPVRKRRRHGFILEDDHHVSLYEAILSKSGMVSSEDYLFSNLQTGESRTHKVGQVIDSKNGKSSDESYFSFDGDDIWDILHDSGIRIKTELINRIATARFTVTRYGSPYAVITVSGTRRGKAGSNFLFSLSNQNTFRVTSTSQNTELLFLILFALGRSKRIIID